MVSDLWFGNGNNVYQLADGLQYIKIMWKNFYNFIFQENN